MQVAIVFAALFAVASAGVLAPTVLSAGPVISPLAVHAPVLRAGPILAPAALTTGGLPVARTVLAGPAPIALAHPGVYAAPAIIG